MTFSTITDGLSNVAIAPYIQDGFFDVDAYTREMVLKDSGENIKNNLFYLGAEKDKNIQRVVFRVPSIVENVELTDATHIYVHIQSMNQEPIAINLSESSFYKDDSYIYIVWKIDTKVTQYSGLINFSICIQNKAADGDNFTIYWQFNSQPTDAQLVTTLKASENAVEPPTEDTYQSHDTWKGTFYTEPQTPDSFSSSSANDNNTILIDAITRRITMPGNLNFGIETDHNIKTIYVKFPTAYDGISLTDSTWEGYMIYTNANQQTDKTILTRVSVTEEYVLYAFKIPIGVTIKAGVVNFAFSLIYRVDTPISETFNSEDATAMVHATISCDTIKIPDDQLEELFNTAPRGLVNNDISLNKMWIATPKLLPYPAGGGKTAIHIGNVYVSGNHSDKEEDTDALILNGTIPFTDIISLQYNLDKVANLKLIDGGKFAEYVKIGAKVYQAAQNRTELRYYWTYPYYFKRMSQENRSGTSETATESGYNVGVITYSAFFNKWKAGMINAGMEYSYRYVSGDENVQNAVAYQRYLALRYRVKLGTLDPEDESDAAKAYKRYRDYFTTDNGFVFDIEKCIDSDEPFNQNFLTRDATGKIVIEDGTGPFHGVNKRQLDGEVAKIENSIDVIRSDIRDLEAKHISKYFTYHMTSGQENLSGWYEIGHIKAAYVSTIFHLRVTALPGSKPVSDIIFTVQCSEHTTKPDISILSFSESNNNGAYGDHLLTKIRAIGPGANVFLEVYLSCNSTSGEYRFQMEEIFGSQVNWSLGNPIYTEAEPNVDYTQEVDVTQAWNKLAKTFDQQISDLDAEIDTLVDELDAKGQQIEALDVKIEDYHKFDYVNLFGGYETIERLISIANYYKVTVADIPAPLNSQLSNHFWEGEIEIDCNLKPISEERPWEVEILNFRITQYQHWNELISYKLLTPTTTINYIENSFEERTHIGIPLHFEVTVAREEDGEIITEQVTVYPTREIIVQDDSWQIVRDDFAWDGLQVQIPREATLVDDRLDKYSKNPVQNRTITTELENKSDRSHKHSMSDITDYNTPSLDNCEEVVQIVKDNFAGGIGYTDSKHTIILPTTTTTVPADGVITLPQGKVVQEGQLLILTINGVEYKVMVKVGHMWIAPDETYLPLVVVPMFYAGDGNIYKSLGFDEGVEIEMEASDVPFALLSELRGEGNLLCLKDFTEGDSVTFSIETAELVKIEEQYMPNTSTIIKRYSNFKEMIAAILASPANYEWLRAKALGTFTYTYNNGEKGKQEILSMFDIDARGSEAGKVVVFENREFRIVMLWDGPENPPVITVSEFFDYKDSLKCYSDVEFDFSDITEWTVIGINTNNLTETI